MKQLVFLLALCIATSSFAQDDDYQTLKTTFGIKAGVNSMAIKTVDENSDFVQKDTGFYVGGFVNIPTSETFSIQPELNYVSGKYTRNDDIKLLHIPVLMAFKISEGFKGYIGPEAVYLLSLDDPNEDEFNELMFGFTFGFSYHITEHLLVEARPYFSLSRFYDDDINYRRYNTLQIGVGYSF